MRILFIATLFLLTSCSQKIYIVRHGEKAEVANNASQEEKRNPDLSTAGHQRAQDLKQRLKGEKIQYFYSTDYKRTRQTIAPTVAHFNGSVETYAPAGPGLNSFVEKLKATKKGNMLIAGHSNTIDDLANAIMGEKVVDGDLPETVYNRLFVITRKGKKYRFKNLSYGQPTE